MKAYWFEPADGKLGYGDGRKPRKGATHKVKYEPVMCKSGLHASVHPFDALTYAQSPVLWVVELGGVIVEGDDKCAATERKYIKRVNVDKVMRQFARECALENIEKAKPYFSEEGWEACIKYLKTGDESVREAARSAAESAAWPAARSAAWYAAESAAWAAARYAAESAAWSAAESAAWAAALNKYRDRLKKMIDEAFGEV